MEVQVKELLESIQKDGIESAQKKADQLLRDARQQAEDITEEAKKEAEEIVKKAQKDAAQTEQSSRAALQQASRDTMLFLEKKIVAVCDAALLGETKKILKPDFLAKLAEDVIKSETLPPQQIQAEFSKKDAAQVHELLKKSLDSELKKGLELTVSKAVSGGFIIRQKDGEGYYDFSDKAIAEMLAAYVNPFLSDLIREAAKQGE